MSSAPAYRITVVMIAPPQRKNRRRLSELVSCARQWGQRNDSLTSSRTCWRFKGALQAGHLVNGLRPISAGPTFGAAAEAKSKICACITACTVNVTRIEPLHKKTAPKAAPAMPSETADAVPDAQ